MAVTTRLVTAAAVLLVLTSLPAEARPAPHRAEERAGTASWSELGVWHYRLKTVRGYTYPTAIVFRGNKLPYPHRSGVAAITATADTAIVQLGDVEELGPLVELPASGDAGRILDRHPHGTVIADPNGHVAFWSTQRPDGAHLVALDTTTGTKTVGPLVRARQRVFAVEGATAYVVDAVLTADPRTSTWTPGQPALTELPPAFDHGGVISDVAADRVLSFDFDDGLYVTDRAGTLLRTIPMFFGTLSPDAAHVVGIRHEFQALYETETGARVLLTGLHGLEPYAARWSPDGQLVVTAASRYAGDDADLATFFACDPADGHCRRLPGAAPLYYVPLLADAFGQFLDYLPLDS